MSISAHILQCVMTCNLTFAIRKLVASTSRHWHPTYSYPQKSLQEAVIINSIQSLLVQCVQATQESDTAVTEAQEKTEVFRARFEQPGCAGRQSEASAVRDPGRAERARASSAPRRRLSAVKNLGESSSARHGQYPPLHTHTPLCSLPCS